VSWLAGHRVAARPVRRGPGLAVLWPCHGKVTNWRFSMALRPGWPLVWNRTPLTMPGSDWPRLACWPTLRASRMCCVRPGTP